MNSLTSIRFAEIFGISGAYQLAPITSSRRKDTDVTDHLSGRTLFSGELNYAKISELYADGALIKATELTAEFSYKNYIEEYDKEFYPLFLISSNETIDPFSIDNPPSPTDGDTIISLIFKKEVLVEQPSPNNKDLPA